MESHQSLVHLDRAKLELEKVEDVEEVKDLRDRAEALRVYQKQAGAGLEIQNRCAEIKIRAERRAGEILRVMKDRGERAGQGGDRANSQAATLPDLLIGIYQVEHCGSGIVEEGPNMAAAATPNPDNGGVEFFVRAAGLGDIGGGRNGGCGRKRTAQKTTSGGPGHRNCSFVELSRFDCQCFLV